MLRALCIIFHILSTWLSLHYGFTSAVKGTCPSDDPSLTPWFPHSDPHKDVVIEHGMKYRLEKSVELRTIYIKDGGSLVFKDSYKAITLSVNFIHIENNGGLYIGSESCRYHGKATILFRGKSYDKDFDAECGKKGLCVAAGGILEIHGEKKLSWTFLDKTLWRGQYEHVITLEDDVSSWEVGDRLVISSTDNNMYHAEEFTIVACSSCSSKQVKIHGKVKYNHYGDYYKGVDMRAEVGILTRNVVTRGDMEAYCYGHNRCHYFTYDTFGGHLMFLRGFKRVQLEGIEIKHMGQQANLGRYPVHFHDCGDLANKKNYEEIAYARDLSIHHCYNRCVTVHGTSSLVVSDVIGYDTLGHCFFLEDGNEQNNTFYHNLGLVTQASTLLPTDRNKLMCMAILGAVWPGYMPSSGECRAVSTFWIAHPNNNFIKNAAGGSEEAGFWFIFHERPTGHGPGSLPPFQALRSPMGKFYKNRVHSSNYGVYIDDGVKPTVANKYKPQEYLSRQMAEYMPHKDSNPKKARSPAVLEKIIAYKNNFGIRARGGDIFVVDSYFADNGNAVDFSSSKSFPYDKGSHQEIANSIIIGQSDNGHHWGRRRREAGPLYNITNLNSTKSIDLELMNVTQIDQLVKETAEIVLTHPASSLTGVEVKEGPVIIKNCQFYEFWGDDVAVTFSAGSVGQMSPLSGVSKLKFGHHVNRFSIGPHPKTDGDKTRILHDMDGSLLGYKDSYIMNIDNWLTRHIGCKENWDCKCAICKGKYGSLFIRGDPEHYQTLKIWRHEAPRKPVSLDGIVTGSGAMQRVEYHPNILRNKGYLLSWGWSLPHDIVIYPVAFDKGDYTTIGLCVKDLPEFYVYWELEKRGCGNSSVIIKSERFYEAASWEEMHSMTNRFYVDSQTGMVFFKITTRYGRSKYNYCSRKGCERWHFVYQGPSPMQDCIPKTFPKYKWSDKPGVTVPKLTGKITEAQPAVKGAPPFAKQRIKPGTSTVMTVSPFWTLPFTTQISHRQPMSPSARATTLRLTTPLSTEERRMVTFRLTTPIIQSTTIDELVKVIFPHRKNKGKRKHFPRKEKFDPRNPYLSHQTPFPWRNKDTPINPYTEITTRKLGA